MMNLQSQATPMSRSRWYVAATSVHFVRLMRMHSLPKISPTKLLRDFLWSGSVRSEIKMCFSVLSIHLRVSRRLGISYVEKMICLILTVKLIVTLQTL